MLNLYYNHCVDDNECLNNPCGGSGTCFNTPGSYRCGCPEGYQFDGKLNVCVQVRKYFFIIHLNVLISPFCRLVLDVQVLHVLSDAHP